MIRIPVPDPGLGPEIEAISPTWLRRAENLTATNRAAGAAVAGGDGIWSEIKPVFVRLQRNKCAYCERQLDGGAIEWDIEHFRPKARVDAWDELDEMTGVSDSASATGYYLLTFDTSNYLASCKPCNSVHKRNFFPVAGLRSLHTQDIARLADERPLLINPIDPGDVDPCSVLGFRGALPRSIAGDEFARYRARVTALVLNLGREDLVLERSRLIASMWVALCQAERDPTDSDANDVVNYAMRPSAPHTSCVASFVRLFRADRAAARGEVDLALELIRTFEGAA